MPASIPIGGLGFTLLSCCLTATVVGNAYYQKKQFYPSVVYITKSNPSMAAIYLMAFTLVILFGKLLKKIFFGTLRPAESEHLIERFFYAVTETCLAFTVFRDDFSPKFVALFTVLLFLKAFHWLADYRVDYMERSPVITAIFHIRVASLLVLLSTIDILLLRHAYHSTVSLGASVQLVFGFEYAILLTVVYNIGVKYVCHGIDLHSENPWENKAMYLLYMELVVGFVKVLLYVIFLLIMIRIHTFPLFIIRPMYLTMKSFKKALQDMLQSRRAIHNMNTLYPNATPEDLQQSDNVCIICREEMTVNTGVKKLPCNHLFHALCLRSWFQRQQTCPTCRLDVLRQVPAATPATTPPPAAAAAAAGQQQQRRPMTTIAELMQQLIDQHQQRNNPQQQQPQQPQQRAAAAVAPGPFAGFMPPFPPLPLMPVQLMQQILQQQQQAAAARQQPTTTTTTPSSGAAAAASTPAHATNTTSTSSSSTVASTSTSTAAAPTIAPTVAAAAPIIPATAAPTIAPTAAASSSNSSISTDAAVNTPITALPPNLFPQLPPFLGAAAASGTMPPPFAPLGGMMGGVPGALPPMPPPPPNYSGLTQPELEAMEGRLRSHVEARVAMLRNTAVLVQAAVVQLTQYNELMARLDVTAPLASTAPTAATLTTPPPAAFSSQAAAPASVTTTPQTTTATGGASSTPSPSGGEGSNSPATASTSNGSVAGGRQPSDANKSQATSSSSSFTSGGEGSSAAEEVRRRRLERFGSSTSEAGNSNGQQQ